MKKRNKKAFELTISTLVIIILAILVLGVLVYAFTIGWGVFWEKIMAFGGKDNVQAIIESCELSCSNNLKYDFCNLERKLIEKGEESMIKCSDLVEKGYLDCEIVC